MPSIIRKTVAADMLPPSNNTVLVVTQSITIQKLMRSSLQQKGLHVTTADDGLEALTAVAKEKPALAFLYLNLPQMDAYHICLIIRKNSQFRDLPIVLMGPSDGTLDKIRAKLAGATDFLRMPFTSPELLTIVEKYLPAMGIS